MLDPLFEPSAAIGPLPTNDDLPEGIATLQAALLRCRICSGRPALIAYGFGWRATCAGCGRDFFSATPEHTALCWNSRNYAPTAPTGDPR